MEQATSEAQGWERLWANKSELSDYWENPEPAVVEWARGLGSHAGWVLDLGCGVGRHTLALARQDLDVVGGDLSASGLAACAERLRAADEVPRVALHDMRRLPYASRSFDGLLSFNVIYHTTWERLRAIMAEIGRVLRPGAGVYLTFVGRHPQRMARYREDVVRGVCRELEPFTFVYDREVEGDKDVPHHYSDEVEVRALLSDFEQIRVRPVNTDFVDEQGKQHVNVHYHVWAQRGGEVGA